EDFRKAGKIRYAGLSNFTEARAEAARVSAEKLGIQGIAGIQNQWSLSKGDPTWAYTDESFVKWHTRHNIAAFPYTPQANGYFRRLENGTISQASDLVRALFHTPLNQERYERIRSLQFAAGLTMNEIVLGYLLGQPFPTFPIIGPKKVADLEESLKAANAALTAENIAFLVK